MSRWVCRGSKRAHPGVSAHVRAHLGLEGGDDAVVVGGQRDALLLVAGLHRQQVLRAGLDEAQWATQSQGQAGGHREQARFSPWLLPPKPAAQS